MKNGYLFFAGIFTFLVLSWIGIVWGTDYQIGALGQHYDSLDELGYPQKEAGIAAQGRLVYGELGCSACHTQQVRRPGFGFDKLRGWGQRQSVARDYLFQVNPPLGAMRLGPDLANFGERALAQGYDRARLLDLLSSGKGAMPPFPSLFETRPVMGRPLPNAMPGKTLRGEQLLPSQRAEALAYYILSLRQEYVYPEAEPIESAPNAAK